MRRAGILGHHPPRDKEHQLASRKCRRESTPQTPTSVLQNLALFIDDPVARCARPGPSAELHRPPPNRRTTIPLKRRGRRRPAAAAPARAGRSADRAPRRPRIEITKTNWRRRRTHQADRTGRADSYGIAPPSLARARVRAAIMVNGDNAFVIVYVYFARIAQAADAQIPKPQASQRSHFFDHM
jgi:hypothetical protein